LLPLLRAQAGVGVLGAVHYAIILAVEGSSTSYDRAEMIVSSTALARCSQKVRPCEGKGCA